MLRNPNEPDIEPAVVTNNNQAAKRATAIASSAVAATDSADIAAIFTMVGAESLKLLFENLLKYILLPIAAASVIVLAILDWRQVWLQRAEEYSQIKGHNIAKAIIRTLSALAITTAVVGGLLFAPIFGAASAIIFASTFGANALINIGTAIYFGVKTHLEKNDPIKKAEYSAKCRDAAIGSVIGIIGTVAIVATMILLKPVFAVLGVIAGTMGAVAGVLGIFGLVAQAQKDRQAAAAEAVVTEPARLNRDTTTGLASQFTINRDDYRSLQDQSQAVVAHGADSEQARASAEPKKQLLVDSGTITPALQPM